MKISVSDRKRYLPLYLLFLCAFALAMILLSSLGFFLSQKAQLTEMIVPECSSPTVSLPTVILDAGHGGEDGGTVGLNGIYEKDLNLEIAALLDQMLQVSGFPTVMTRTEDILLYDKNSDYHGQKKVQDLATRRKIAEQYDNAIFISIHMNAFPQSQYSGLQVYYSLNDTRSFSLAQSIQQTTKETLLPNNQRKIKPTNGNLYLLDHLQCPAVLIECGFLSNPDECQRLSTEEYRQQLAIAIALSIFRYCEE